MNPSLGSLNYSYIYYSLCPPQETTYFLYYRLLYIYRGHRQLLLMIQVFHHNKWSIFCYLSPAQPMGYFGMLTISNGSLGLYKKLFQF